MQFVPSRMHGRNWPAARPGSVWGSPVIDRRMPGVRALSVVCMLPLVGLLSANAAAADGPPSGADRDLLMRTWDLNKDGTIDEGEAEVARLKMRRERAELQAKALSGGKQPGEKQPGDDEPVQDGEPRRGGLFGPEQQPAEPEPRPRPADQRPKRQELNAAARPGRAPAGGKDADRGPAVVTGGSRAGGLARPGYGSAVPRGELNAGRPIPPRAVGQRPPMSGGLLPVPRRGPTPAPAAAPAGGPRVTAEDVPY